eukprot:2473493-Amphidinium_carterae.1
MFQCSLKQRRDNRKQTSKRTATTEASSITRLLVFCTQFPVSPSCAPLFEGESVANQERFLEGGTGERGDCLTEKGKEDARCA